MFFRTVLVQGADGPDPAPAVATAERTLICPLGSPYKLRLPPGIPAKLYWAVTLYNAIDGTMPETPQLLPSINQYDRPHVNDDGSVELWFSPRQPSDVRPENWIQSIPDHTQLVAVRLYGVEEEFYTQTWKPDDLVPVASS